MGQLQDAFMDAAGEVANIKAQPSNRYWWLYATIINKNGNGTLDVKIDGSTIHQVKATVSCMMSNIGDRVIVLKAGPLMTCVDVIATIDKVKIPSSALPTASTTDKGIMQAGSGLTVSDGIVSVDNGAYVNLYTDSANNGYCAYRRSGGLVCVVCDYVSSTAKTNKKLGTLPAGCRPARTVLGMAYPRGSNSSGQITVDPDGEVSLYTFEGSSGYVGGSVTFPLP